MAGNGLNSESPDCPLCLEPLGWDDINFYPCSCRYQICRFCWHRIRTDENGLCPHCREPYPENPAEYTPPSQEQLAKLKSEKRQKTVEKRQKLVDSRKNLASVRVVQKNLVFVIGLSPRLADPEVLKKNEYFGKYGRIYKVVINNHTVYNGAQGPSVSAYVTYYRSDDASKAIQAVNNAYIDGRYLKVSFGTTKYCTYFLRGTQCTKPDCMYLHALGDNEASFTKEDMQMGKHQVFESATLAANNPPAKEPPGSRKQPLKTVVVPSSATDASESILPATASWASLSKIPGGIEPLPTLQSPFPVYSHSSSKETKSDSNSIGPHSTSSESNSIINGPHSYSIDIESHTGNIVDDAHTFTRSQSHSSDGSHTSNSVPHSNAVDEIHSHVGGGVSNSHLNSGLHPANTGSHSTNSGSRSTNSGLHPSTGSGSHSHTTSGSNSHSSSGSHSHPTSGSHSHSTSGLHSHPTSGSHSHSSSSRDSSGSSKTHQLHSSTSSRHTHSQPQQHLHGHKTHSHSSGSHAHSSSSGSHSHNAHGTHSHVSHSKHSSHSHSSHGGSSGHTKHTHKSTDSSMHRSDSERERTSKSSRSSGLTSPSSEPSKRHSSRDRVSEHRHSRGGSSSKSNTPSQSPKSSMSTSSSSGSLKQLQQDCGSDSKPSGSGGGGGGEKEGGGVKQAHSAEKLSSEGGSGSGSLVLESMEDWEEEGSLDSCVGGIADGGREDGVGGDRLAAHTPPSGVRKTQEETSGTAVNVIPVLSAAGRGQFGALGVTWSTQAPNLTHPPPQPEDDLGFDPWDESNKGLADLLETEENATTMPRCIGKEKRDSTHHHHQRQQQDTSNGLPEQHMQGRGKLEADEAGSRDGEVLSSSATMASWQDEFRSVFPNVNISFSDPWPSSKPRNDNKATSLHNAVEDTTGYNTTPLAPTLAYVYPQLVATSLSLNPSCATTSASQASLVEAKLLRSEEGQGRSEWPDFSDNSIGSGTSGQQQQQQQQRHHHQHNSWPTDGSTNRESSSTGNGPPPPPGFTAKGKDSSGPNTLSNSVNHSFWANATGQVGHLYHNQLMQSWAHYMQLKAVPPQQLSRNQQQLLAQQQQYLARAQQALLMQGHPFLHASMGMQIRPGVVGVNMGHTAVHSGTPAVSLGHTAHAVNGGASGQVIPSTSSVSGQVTGTVPASAAKHEMTVGSDETVLNQPGSLYRIVEHNIRNKTDMAGLPRTAKKSTLK